MKWFSIWAVALKSAMTPLRMGFTAVICSGVRPSISLASVPTASTAPESLRSATIEGSLTTMPFLRSNTSVFAVPRSIARSEEKTLRRDGVFICRGALNRSIAVMEDPVQYFLKLIGTDYPIPSPGTMVRSRPMDSRNIIEATFGVARALIGVVHAGPLPGAPGCRLAVAEMADLAAREAAAYRSAGFHGLILENTFDRPYLRGAVGPEVVAAMAVIAGELRRAAGIPLGVQV